MKSILMFFILAVVVVIGGCSTASSIQQADQSESAFDGAVYEGQTTVLRDDIPDSDAYRIFHQGATGFVSVQSVRGSAERRAKQFCEDKGLRYELLRESTSVGAQVMGNFPRSELVFACVESSTTAPVAEKPEVSSDRYDELRKLKSLLDDGVITQEEYDQEKGEILGR
jgi:hypothetical protein